MKISNKKLEKAIVELTVAFESDEWKSTQDKALNKLAKSVKIDGFRPGKAPVALIKSRISKASILQEASDMILQDKFVQILTDAQVEKFAFLKGSKRIPRVKPDGTPYYYTEGAMPFPDNLDAPARTMLTSEGGVSRTTHVIEDFKTKKPRLLTPVECERINGFPDNWTNTGMTQKKRNFMMGNALVVGVIEKIGIEIENIIDKEN